MPKVNFSKPFDYNPSGYGGRVTIRYKPGKSYDDVKRECIEMAEKAGALPKKPKPKADDDE